MSAPSTRRLLRAVPALALLAVLPVVTPAHAASRHHQTYVAPFGVGASGGDQFSYHSASNDGTVTVARAYPVPGAINCTKGGPYAKLLVRHRTTRQVHKVVVSYDSAAVDNFTFALVGLRDARHHWFGTTTVRGFIAGAGKIVLKPDRQRGRYPHDLRVEFGLQQSSACPNVDAGTIRFTKVEIS